VSFDLAPGEVLGFAGESGSGKSTLAQALLRMLKPPAVITGGEVGFAGEDVLAMDAAALARFRWRAASIVLQSALDALNPVLTIGDQLVDTLRAHPPWPDRRAARARATELLALVGLGANELDRYPHQLSGGMRQRVCVAMALALGPRLVLLDEPTTALDVVVQRELVQRLLALRDALGFAVIFITHDLSLLFDVADRVGVLYGGRLVEIGPAATLRATPAHPYTRALLRAMPSVSGARQRLVGLPNAPCDAPSDALGRSGGCGFAPRCVLAAPRCVAGEPPLRRIGRAWSVACVAALEEPEQ
jgi:peptide/nickel transport system ATP-binding protein